MAAVDFYLGLGSRYSYLAASQVDRIAAKFGCHFVWKPIASGELIDRRGSNPFRNQAPVGQYDPAYREQDARRWAAYYGIPFAEPAAFGVDAVVPALACLAAERQGALVRCCQLLFRLIFAEGVALDGRAISSLPVRLGLDVATFMRDLESRETRSRHDALVEEAATRGAFGVPTFFLGGHMFWGNDRLPLLEAALRDKPKPDQL